MKDSDKALLEERAFAIFLKKIPGEYLTDKTLAAFKSVAEQSVDMARLFTDTFRDTLSTQIYDEHIAKDKK